MLPNSKTQEWLSEANFKTVTTMAGLNIARDDGDFGFDGYLSEPWARDGSVFPGTGFIAIQIKSVTGARVTEEFVTYRLKLRAYDILRDTSFSFPSLLILFVLPSSNTSEWVTCQEDTTSINGAAYWHDLKGMRKHETKTNYADAKVTIKIPRSQQFSIAGANSLWNSFKLGEPLATARKAE